MPIEVYPSTPHPARPDSQHRYGLISGFRRLAAFRSLAETYIDKARFAAIPAFVRSPESVAELYHQMVLENASRAEVSPWEQAMVAVLAVDREAHAGIDALYKNLGRFKRTRLRAIAHLADELSGSLTAPETLSERQLLRLAPLIPRGFGDLLRATLKDTPNDPEAEWRALLPILLEAERPESETTPARPGRALDLGSRGLKIRRERSTASSTRSSACSARPSPASRPEVRVGPLARGHRIAQSVSSRVLPKATYGRRISRRAVRAR